MHESRKVNLLLVDDEPKNLLALEAVLGSEDRTLVRAGSGEEALRYLLKDTFAAILLDVQMPGLDGFETAALIRGREKTRDTPIIFLTAANRADAHVAEGYSLGAVDYILKPFDPEILRSKVAVFVELARKSEQIERQAQQLAEATAFLTNVLESSTEYAIVAEDLEGLVLAWNEGARRIYGYTADEMVGKQNARILHAPEDIASGRVDAILTTTLETGKLDGEFERVRKDGRRFPAQLAITLRRDAAGRPIGYVSISKDITQQKLEEARAQLLIREQAARAEAEAAQRRFAFLAEASRVVSSSLDRASSLQGLAHLAVPTLGDVCAIDLLEDDGQVCRAAIAHADPLEGPADREAGQLADTAASAELLGVLRTGRPALDPDAAEGGVAPAGVPAGVTANGASPAGAGSPGSRLIVPLLARGRVLGAISLRAGSGRRYHEGDLSLAEDLARRVAMAVDNARLYHEAQQALRIRDDFVTAASHDLKTPLTVIKGQTSLLQRRARLVDTPDGKRIVDGLAVIELTTTKMARIIDEMLDLALRQMGRPLELDLETIDLLALAREVIGALSDPEQRHRARLETVEPALVGRWDPARLERVLSNLLSNAFKYSPDGTDVVVTATREEDLAVDWAVLRVSDHGVGIPADELPRVFEWFRRGSNVVGKVPGTGVGLAGARQIVEQHGGTIGMVSEEGVGTTVTVRLPLAKPLPSGEAR